MRLLFAVAIALTAASIGYAQDRVIRGQVIDAASRVPVAHARVRAMVPPQRTGLTPLVAVDTDDRGEFSLAVPKGTTWLRITKATYALATLAVPVSDLYQQVRLVPGAVITGRLLDSNGAPATGFIVSAAPATPDPSLLEDSPFFALADERGEFRIGGLPEGRYIIKTAPEGGEPPASIAVKAGEQVDLALGRVPADTCRGLTAPAAPAKKQAVVQGVVLTESGIPLSCTSVRLDTPIAQLPEPAQFLDRSELQTLTDVQGRFEFPVVPEGVYSVDTFRRGFVRSREGPIEVLARPSGESRSAVVADLTIRLAPAGVIAGVVYDHRGEPVQESTVVARQVRIIDGHPIAAGSTTAFTDDRGRFRLFGLDSGRWIISSTNDGPQPLPGDAPLPFYYPGTPDSRLAVPIPVTGSEVHDGVDIQRARVEGITLSGSVVDATGQPLADGNVILDVSYRSGALKTQTLPNRVVNGRFQYNNVAPGDYVVQVGRNTGRTWEFGRVLVSVGDTAPPPLSIRTTAGRSVSGLVRLDDGSAPAALVRVRLTPVAPDDTPAGILVAEQVPVADGEFRAEHVVGANRFVLANASATWYLKSVRIAGRETVDQPFDFGFGNEPVTDVEIVVSSAGASVTGSLRDGKAARRGYMVIAFSTDAGDWYSRSPRVKFARPTSDGRFRATGLPPGAYYVAAVPPLDDVVNWQDAVSLDGLTGRAERITLDEGQTRDVVLPSP